MICFAAKWLGSDEVLFYSDYQNGHAETVKAAHKLLSEADGVITYNGDRYDIKRLNNEFLQLGMAPPKSPALMSYLSISTTALILCNDGIS